MTAKRLQESPSIVIEPAFSDLVRMTELNTYHHACRGIVLPDVGLVAFDSTAYNHAEMLIMLESVFGIPDVPLKLRADQQVLFLIPPQLEGKVVLVICSHKTYTDPLPAMQRASKAFAALCKRKDVHWVKNDAEDEVRYQVETSKERDALVIGLAGAGIKVKLKR